MAQSFTWPIADPTPAAVTAPPRAARPVPGVDYGTDFNTFPDLDFTPISGLDAIAQALVRSLMDAAEGVDLQLWLNDDLSPAGLYDLQQTIETQCVADERVRSATVAISQPDRLSLGVDILVVPEGGNKPFKLVLTVDQLTVQVLSIEAAT